MEDEGRGTRCVAGEERWEGLEASGQAGRWWVVLFDAALKLRPDESPRATEGMV